MESIREDIPEGRRLWAKRGMASARAKRVKLKNFFIIKLLQSIQIKNNK
jgi:hypothetical protein